MNLPKDNRLMSLALPPVLWAAHFVLSYIAVSLACAYDVPSLFGMDPAKLVIAIATVAALLILGYAGKANHSKWLAVGTGQEDSAGMGRFFAMTSLMLCVLSAVAVMLTGLPILMLPNCTY